MDRDLMMQEPCQSVDKRRYEDINKDMREFDEKLLEDYKLNRDID